MLLEPFNKDYFKALVILLPGFITLKVSSYLATGIAGKSDLELTIGSLAYSLLDFTIATLLYATFQWTFGRLRLSASSPIAVPFLLLLIAVSIGTGWLNALVEERGVLYKVARTARTSSERPWVTVFRKHAVSRDSFVKVTMASGLVYGGWPESASESEDNELFIRPAYLIRPNARPRLIGGEGVLVFGRDIVAVEFIEDHPLHWNLKQGS